MAIPQKKAADRPPPFPSSLLRLPYDKRKNEIALLISSLIFLI